MPDLTIVGLDLGQTSDPTALAVVRRTAVLDGAGAPLRNGRGRGLYDYLVAHLHRFPLGTPYPKVVADVGTLVGHGAVQGGGAAPPVLGVDATGVGRAVVDLFLDAGLPCDLHPVTITGGESGGRRDSWNHAGGWPSGPWSYWVPKLELAGAVQAGLSSGRLKVVPRPPLAEALRKELLEFRVRITAAATTQLGTWREGAHDDLVLAVAVAVWLGENLPDGASHLHGAVRVPLGRPGRLASVPLEQRLGGHRRNWDRGNEDRDGNPPRRPRRNFYGR